MSSGGTVAGVHSRSALLSPADGLTSASPPTKSLSKSLTESWTANGPITSQSRSRPFSTSAAFPASLLPGRFGAARNPSSAPRGVRPHCSGGLASGQSPVALPRQPLTGSAAHDVVPRRKAMTAETANLRRLRSHIGWLVSLLEKLNHCALSTCEIITPLRNCF